MALAACALALASCTALASSTSDPAAADVPTAAPSMPGEQVDPSVPEAATGATLSPTPNSQEDMSKGETKSQDCITVALLIDKLGATQLGNLTSKDLDSLQAGLKNLAPAVPGELKSQLATVESKLNDPGYLESEEFATAVNQYIDWLNQHCSFQ